MHRRVKLSSFLAVWLLAFGCVSLCLPSGTWAQATSGKATAGELSAMHKQLMEMKDMLDQIRKLQDQMEEEIKVVSVRIQRGP